MNKVDFEKKHLPEEILKNVSGGEIGDGKYGGDGGYDDYFWFKCPICGSHHFFVEDLTPEKVYRDGTVRPSCGLFRCMDCGKVVMYENV